jgi:hypothetical protein
VLRFALDQNFPAPVVDALKEYLIEAELVSIRAIDPRLARVDDWQLLLALHLSSPRCDGLITTDSAMTSLPRELAVLMQTKLTLVIAAESGHDPLKATGLVLAHLPQICKRSKRDTPQIWSLRAATREHDDPWSYLQRIAKREKKTAQALMSEMRLSPQQLSKHPLHGVPED